MAIITYINNIPLFNTPMEAIEYGKTNNIEGYHTHVHNGLTGYMSGDTHHGLMDQLSQAQQQQIATTYNAYGAQVAQPVVDEGVKQVYAVLFDTRTINYMGETRKIRVVGEPGAEFRLTLVNRSDTNYIDVDTPGFVSASIGVEVELPESGEYSFNQKFPKVSAHDRYKINIQPLAGTVLSPGIPTISPTYEVEQWATSTLTLSLRSAGNSGSYATLPANVTITSGVTSKHFTGTSYDLSRVDRTSISWEIGGASGTTPITISRQPRPTDFDNNIASRPGQQSNTKFKAKTIGDSISTSVNVSSADVANISANMVVEAPSEGIIDQREELRGASRTTAKRVSVGTVDESPGVLNPLEISSEQRIPHGTVLNIDNGGTFAVFEGLKAEQKDKTTILVTAKVKLMSMGSVSLTSTLALDNFISV